MSIATIYLHAVASLDGNIADEHDNVGPLHSAPFRVSAASADYVRGMWSRQKVIVIGRHLFDPTNGWEAGTAKAPELAGEGRSA